MVSGDGPGDDGKGALQAMASWADKGQGVIEVISRKWAVQVLEALAQGPRGYDELLSAVGDGIHQGDMDGALSHLEQFELVRRQAAATPPAIWYELTDLGESLLTRSPPWRGGWRTTGSSWQAFPAGLAYDDPASPALLPGSPGLLPPVPQAARITGSNGA